MLAINALSRQTPLKCGHVFPATEITQNSKFKAEDTSICFLRNIRMYQCYNIIYENILILIFAGVRTSAPREQDQLVYCIWLIITESFWTKQQNLCRRIQRLLQNSTIRCLLHISQLYDHTLSYNLSYSLTWPNIAPASWLPGFPHFIFVVIFLEIFIILLMRSTCFNHQFRSAYSIRSVTYDKCFRFTSVRWSCQMTVEHAWIRLLYRWSFM